MSHNLRSWIFGIVFWLLYLISISAGLNGGYRWLNTAWVLSGLLFGAVASVLLIVEVSRKRGGSGDFLYHRGVPRFMRSVMMDDEQFAKDLEKRKLWDMKRQSK
jgi:hypothetical protein